MGMPKRKVVELEKVFESPTLGDRIRLLEFGKETGKALNFAKLPDVLEEVKKILLPIVESLNKSIAFEPYFANNPLPRNFQNRRGVHLFESRFMDIWLERSGRWFVRLRAADGGRILKEADSLQLAEIIIERQNDFLKDSLRYKNFLDEIPCLKSIAFYNAMFVYVLKEFFKSADEVIRRREEKTRVMRDWLELMDDFGKSLDPLVSQGKKVDLKDYGILEETERGIRNCADLYFTSKALKPVWDVIEKHHGGRSGYTEHIGKLSFRSLFDIIQRMGWIVESMERADGRLPLTEEEMAVLEEFIGSITK